MKSEVISFFYDFKCIAGDCPDNCCRSWNLIVDEETLLKYRNMPGEEGRKMRRNIKKNPSGGYCLKAPFGKCRYQDKSGLCCLQRDGREECMPKVCRLFPRYTVSYGGYEIGVIDLACGTAAELFLAQNGRLTFVPAKEKLSIYWDLAEADPGFAGVLREDLELILDRLWGDKKDFWELQKDIFAHVYGMHLKLVRNDGVIPQEIPFDIGYVKKSHTGELPWLLTERYKEAYRRMPLLPMSFVNKVIYTEFSDIYLLVYHPHMVGLIRSYRKRFRKVYESRADEVFTDMLDALFERHVWLEEKLKGYFSYKLQMLYMGASVDYYLLEPVIMAALCTQVLVLLVITFTGENDDFDIGDLAGLITENERLLCHNTSFRERIMKKVREDLF